ncbi:MAG TPA: hypothetical protein VN328_10905, partial [Thermodesulfovibrionales bacterium]|nr:hypothetical protein [Thermodesulfovibrionales bacterium]
GSCGKSFTSENVAGAAPVSPQPAAQSSPGSWQVFVGEKLPEIMAIPGMSAPGVFSTVPTQKTGVSLSKTVWTVAITTATDLVTAFATGNPASRQAAYLRGGLAVVTLVSGLLAGSKRGWASRIVMAASLGIAFVQSGSVFSFAERLLENPQMLSGVLPSTVTQSLSFLAALRAAWVARG